MSFKGWTKLDSYSWRHDGNNLGQNKLNICRKEPDTPKGIGRHVSETRGQSQHGYVLVYTINDAPSEYASGSHVISEHDTLAEAERAAADVQRNNPSAPPL